MLDNVSAQLNKINQLYQKDEVVLDTLMWKSYILHV